MIDVKSFNIHVFFFNMYSLKILNLKKEIKEKNLIFVKINAV